MSGIDLQAKITYHPFDTENYQWIHFVSPTLKEDGWDRGATKWEQECLDTANTFLEKLFSVQGFTECFTRNQCRMKKEAVTSFLQEVGSSLAFPNTREYNMPFEWYWCQLQDQSKPGHIMDWNGWFYDKLAEPTITVTVDGKEFQPFRDAEQCFVSCVNEDWFAWRLCEASAYNAPYLYSIVKSYNYDISNLYEGAFDTFTDPKLYAVLELFDNSILPTYNVIVEESSMVVEAGTYSMHIVDINKANLREIIRKNKAKINEIIKAQS